MGIHHRAALERLRFGLPPTGSVRTLTVGWHDHRRLLEDRLRASGTEALLIVAPPGGGKSHLLQFVREMALNAGHAVSLVTAYPDGDFRFDSMEAVFGAVCQNLEVAGSEGRGVGALFGAFAAATVPERGALQHVRDRVTSRGRWDYSEALGSPPLYVALRAWVTSDDGETRGQVEDWLGNPSGYHMLRKRLYETLVLRLRRTFREPRPEWKLYAEQAFGFHQPDGGAWRALAGLATIARLAMLRGLVLLFDEFDGVLDKLPRTEWKREALANLIRFADGTCFPDKTYFAVGLNFTTRCKRSLLERGVLDFDYARLEGLPHLEVPEVGPPDLLDLAFRVRTLHGAAYGWDAESAMDADELRRVVEAACAGSRPERVRPTVQAVIQALDGSMDA